MADCSAFDGKVFCLITGGSKGFGRASAISFAKQCNFAEGSIMMITGRDEVALQKTKSLVQEINNKIKVQINIFDLADMTALETFTSKLSDVGQNFDLAILINNAGSLGDITAKAVSPKSYEALKRYFDLNIISVILLVQGLFSTFKSTKKIIVNISSLAAIKEMPYMSLYCTSKAARDMLHKVIACEEEGARVLNYAPGPMDTAMVDDLQENCGNEETRKFFKQLRDTKTILDPEVSAMKMVRILKGDKFTSGDHIDYYDIE